MLTDVFLKRHQRQLWYNHEAARPLASMFNQVLHILDDLQPVVGTDDAFFGAVHDRLARELGLPYLVRGHMSYARRIGTYLGQPYDLWNDEHGDIDYFLKSRLSMLELLFRQLDERLAERDAKAVPPKRSSLFGGAGSQPLLAAGAPSADRMRFNEALAELNTRLRESGIGLVYHNGFLHFASDRMSVDRVQTPFWEVLAAPQWRVADREMKEAIEHLDRADDDAAVHALCALESVMKILCEERGWSTGKEKGAVNFIENLQSDRSGRFISPWEADALRALFREIRNPRSHGGGTSSPDALSIQQLTWVVETSMSWTKSLATRP